MKIINIIFHLLLIILLASCSNIQEKETKTSFAKNDTVKANPNVGGFAFNYNLENYQTTGVVHNISENEIYKANIELINHFKIENSFKVYFFLNNELIHVVYNKKDVPYLNYKSLMPGESLTKSFQIPNIKKGKNCLVMLLVRNPDQGLKKEEFLEFVNFTKRYTIISGNSNENNMITKEPIPIKNASLLGTKVTYLVPFGQKNTPENALTYKKIETKDLSVLLNFWNDSPNKLYSIILLDNDEQIPIKDSLYKIEKEGSSSIKFRFKLNNAKKHNLVVLIVLSPEETPDIPSNGALTTNKITILN
jgi:hypothetical protein